MMSYLRTYGLIVSALVLAACSTNPVTGKNELILVGENWELETGKKHYAPLRQSQGGDYVVDPKVEAYVRGVGNRLAKVSDRKLPYEFNVINDGVPNAWALPGGKISINRGLLVELKNEAQLAAVLGHEIVHAAAKHGARAQTRGVGLQLFAVGTAVGLGDKIGGQAAQMVGAGAAQMINQSYGRKAERESDEFGIKYMVAAGYDPVGAIELQKTFVKLSAGRKAGFFDKYFTSHPVSQNRVNDNRGYAAKYPKSGELGADRYQRAMARLMKSKPAYDKFENARAAHKKGDVKNAVALVNQAIKIEPKEALFYSALGDVANSKNNYKAAKGYYDKAIALNKEYFYYYLRRGEVNQKTRNFTAAKRDLQRSLSLLPTADAEELLGDVSSLTNDRSGALAAYKRAAQGGGRSAYSKLLKMDLDKNPQQYLAAKTGLTKRGTLGVQVSNSTPNSITGIEVAIRSLSNGKVTRRKVPGVLASGKTTIVDFGLKITQKQMSDVKAQVTKARLAR